MRDYKSNIPEPFMNISLPLQIPYSRKFFIYNKSCSQYNRTKSFESAFSHMFVKCMISTKTDFQSIINKFSVMKCSKFPSRET